jgi:hypothetical protein
MRSISNFKRIYTFKLYMILSISNRQIRWALFRNLILQLAVFFPTVYNAVPSRDRAVTETT